MDDNSLYNRLFFVGNSLYLAASGGLCGLDGQASLYELPYKAVLPITISNFTAESIDDANRLQWQVQQSSITAFNIQRSTDTKNFITIGSLDNKAASATEQTYTFLDNNPEKPVSYYRLQYIEAEGKATYSVVRKVNNSNTNFSAALQSHLVQSQLIVNLASNIQTQAHISCYSLAGVPVIQNSLSVLPGATSKMVDVAKLTKGMYMLKVETTTKTVFLKFIKM